MLLSDQAPRWETHHSGPKMSVVSLVCMEPLDREALPLTLIFNSSRIEKLGIIESESFEMKGTLNII